MMRCEQVDEIAGAVPALPSDDPERLDVEAHARGCQACARKLREAERLEALLRMVPPPPGPAPELLDLMVQTHRAMLIVEARARRRLPFGLAALAGLSWALLLVVARQRLPGVEPALESASGALGAALLVAGAATALRWRVPLVALVVSAVLVALGARDGALEALIGVKCVLTEWLAAALPLGFFFLKWRAAAAERTSAATAGMAEGLAVAAGGAVAGQAALIMTCPVHTHGAHLVVFHFGGVALLAVLSWAARKKLNYA